MKKNKIYNIFISLNKLIGDTQLKKLLEENYYQDNTCIKWVGVYPYEINDQQASVIVQVFKHLIPLMKAYMNHEVAVDFDNGEILFAHDHHGWK